MVKLVIQPDDLIALLKSDTDLKVELPDKTVQTVVSTIASRITNDQVKKHVDKCLEDLIKEKTGWNTHRLAEPFMRMIEDEARRAVHDAFSDKVGSMIIHQIVQETNRMIPQITATVTHDLKANLREIMKETMVELLLTK